MLERPRYLLQQTGTDRICDAGSLPHGHLRVKDVLDHMGGGVLQSPDIESGLVDCTSHQLDAFKLPGNVQTQRARDGWLFLRYVAGCCSTLLEQLDSCTLEHASASTPQGPSSSWQLPPAIPILLHAWWTPQPGQRPRSTLGAAALSKQAAKHARRRDELVSQVVPSACSDEQFSVLPHGRLSPSYLVAVFASIGASRLHGHGPPAHSTNH